MRTHLPNRKWVVLWGKRFLTRVIEAPQAPTSETKVRYREIEIQKNAGYPG